MDDETRAYFDGAFSAQKCLLENLYALVAMQSALPVESVRATRDDMIKGFAATAWGEATPDGDYLKRVTEHGTYYLERFWLAVERRVKSSAQDR